MKPAHITLVRHGESLGNVDHNAYTEMPDWRIPLTRKGQQQATRAARILGDGHICTPIGVYYSPFVRARDTWLAMKREWTRTGAYTPEWSKEDPRIREQEWGRFKTVAERDAAQAESWAFGTFFYRFVQGESGADVYDRCTGFLSTLYRDFAKPHCPNHILIVSHGFTIRLLLMRWLHLTVDDFHTLKTPRNCAIIGLTLGGDGHYRLDTPLERRD